MFFSSPPLSLVPFVHLALELSPEEEVTGVEMGQSCRLFSIPFSWDHASWKHLVEYSHCNPRSVSRCPVLLLPESLIFNTKSLQLRFQKCAKHLSVGLNLLLLPCLPRLQRN